MAWKRAKIGDEWISPHSILVRGEKLSWIRKSREAVDRLIKQSEEVSYPSLRLAWMVSDRIVAVVEKCRRSRRRGLISLASAKISVRARLTLELV